MLRALLLPSCKHPGSIIYAFYILMFTFSLLTSCLNNRIHIRFLKRKKNFILQVHILIFHSYGKSYIVLLTFYLPPSPPRHTMAVRLALLPGTQGITNLGGKKNKTTAMLVFLSKSPFSSPWIPPHCEPGLWDPQWTKTGERTDCTFSLHLQHYSHRGLSTSLQTLHKPHEFLKSSTLKCCYPNLISYSENDPGRLQVPAVQSVSHHTRRAHLSSIYICIYYITKTIHCVS